MPPGRLRSHQLQQQKHFRAFQGGFRTERDRNKDPGMKPGDLEAARAEEWPRGERGGTTQPKKGTGEMVIDPRTGTMGSRLPVFLGLKLLKGNWLHPTRGGERLWLRLNQQNASGGTQVPGVGR